MVPRVQEVRFRSDDRTIQGRVFQPESSETSKMGLLFVHGWRSNQINYESRARTASEALESVCLTFDLGGHGQSSGNIENLTPLDHLRDLTNAFDHLESQHNVQSHRIGICAASYGAYLGALLLPLRPVARLLIRAPALYADEDMGTALDRGRGTEVNLERQTPIENLRRFQGGVLILESGKDEVIPSGVIRAYLDACRGRARHETIANASHSLTDPIWQAAFVAIIVDWFRGL
jgi:uncharacterized protein